MKINVLTVGKIKETFFKEAIAEYSKRLGAYCNLSIIEVADEKTSESMSDTETAMIKDKEGDRLLKHIKEGQFVITLEIEGKQLDSPGLAEYINNLGITGRSNICLVIGGSLGLSDAVRKRSDFALSFSKMTYPHQLMRVILLEQLYRAFRIINGEPYHK